MKQELVKWLMKIIWPIIQDFIVKLVKMAVERIYEAVKVWMDRKGSTAEQAQQHADAAEKRAESGPLEGRNVALAEAKVWREVAENLRRENEEMKSMLDHLRAQELQRAELDAAAMTPTVNESGTVLAIGSERTPIPVDGSS